MSTEGVEKQAATNAQILAQLHDLKQRLLPQAEAGISEDEYTRRIEEGSGL